MTKPIDRATLADAAQAASDDDIPFDPVPLRARHDGWTAARQRAFIEALAESGCVADACAAAGVTPRSAYRLRHRHGADAFALAWREAISLAAHRLTSVAFDRAINGAVRKVWHKGEVVGEERVPSDRLLVLLLKHLDPTRYGHLSGILHFEVPDPLDDARRMMPKLLSKLVDLDAPAGPRA